MKWFLICIIYLFAIAIADGIYRFFMLQINCLLLYMIHVQFYQNFIKCYYFLSLSFFYSFHFTITDVGSFICIFCLLSYLLSFTLYFCLLLYHLELMAPKMFTPRIAEKPYAKSMTLFKPFLWFSCNEFSIYIIHVCTRINET